MVNSSRLKDQVDSWQGAMCVFTAALGLLREGVQTQGESSDYSEDARGEARTSGVEV